MLRVLLAKDLRRAWRNPLPYLINLIVPLTMTALIGLVFGGNSGNGALGQIRFAVVNENKSVLSDFLRGSANQNQGGKLSRTGFHGARGRVARDQRQQNQRGAHHSRQTSCTIICSAREPVSLELIKNPAESIHPAVLEELLGAVVTR